IFLPVNKPPEPDRSQRAADGRADKIRLRTHAPQPRAEKGTARHRAVADEIIRAVSPRAKLRHRLADDERLARRFVERLHRDLAENELHAEARGHEAAVSLPRVEDAAADRAAADHAEIHLLHRTHSLPRNGAG